MGTTGLHRDHHSRQQPCLHPTVYLRCAERKAELPTLSQTRSHPGHTQHADVSSLAPAEKQARAQRPLSGMAVCAKSLVAEYSTEPESCTSRLSCPLQGLRVPFPWPSGQLSSTPELSIADSHHSGGQLPLHCPLQGLESTRGEPRPAVAGLWTSRPHRLWLPLREVPAAALAPHGSSSRERRDSSRWLSITFSCWT